MPGISCSTQNLGFSLWHMRYFSWGMWNLVTWPRIEPKPRALATQSLSHWVTREVLKMPFKSIIFSFSSVQFSSVAQSCPTLCDPMNHSTRGLPVHHHLPEFTQTHVHRIHDAIQPSHPRSSPSPTALNPSQHQSLFQWVNSSHEVAKLLELQL